MGSAIALRRATPSDAAGISAVYDAAVRDGWSYLGELVEQPLFTASYWDKLVADHAHPNALIVATDDGSAVVGYTAVHTEDGELFLLFVHPGWSGRGVGRALLKAAHDALRSAGCGEVFLFTEERNARARAVYRAAGYVESGEVRESDFKGARIRELRLVRAL